MWGLRTLPSMWSASLQCFHYFNLCAQCQKLSPQQPGKSGTWKTVTISLNPHSHPVTGFIVVPVLWTMRGWVSCLRFQDKGAGFEPWLSDFNLSSQTTQCTEVQLHCGTFPALCIVTAFLHEDGMWKGGWGGGWVNEQKGRGASKGNWTHRTQDTCFWHQRSGYSSPLLWAEMSEGPQVKQLIGRRWSWLPFPGWRWWMSRTFHFSW